MIKSYMKITTLFILLFSQTLFGESNNISKIYSDYVAHLKKTDICQKYSIRNITQLYAKLQDSNLSTSKARIVVMINRKKNRLSQIFPTKNLIKGDANEKWYWHSFLLYKNKVYDPRFSLKPCLLKDYFDIVWTNDRNLNEFSFYSIRMINLIDFMDIKIKGSKVFIKFSSVNKDYLLKHPEYLSKKIK